MRFVVQFYVLQVSVVLRAVGRKSRKRRGFVTRGGGCAFEGPSPRGTRGIIRRRPVQFQFGQDIRVISAVRGGPVAVSFIVHLPTCDPVL